MGFRYLYGKTSKLAAGFASAPSRADPGGSTKCYNEWTRMGKGTFERQLLAVSFQPPAASSCH
jgi:hypothetical protein